MTKEEKMRLSAVDNAYLFNLKNLKQKSSDKLFDVSLICLTVGYIAGSYITYLLLS